jgi:hypothetical protein
MKSTLIAIISLLPALAAQAQDPRLVESRDVAAGFQKQLGGTLVCTVKAVGPIQAISVCNKEAPQIAERISQQSGAYVGRQPQG